MKHVSVRVGRAALACSLAISTIVAGARSAAANPEPSLYDSRAVGLAGTGAAWIDNASAIYTNPAGLEGIPNMGATVAFAGILADLSAPVGGPDDVKHTGFSLFPSLMLGGGYRMHDRIVAGAGFYAQTGFGGSYDGIERLYGTDLFFPEDQSVLFFVLETALAASVRVTDRLTVGASARFPYARLDASLTQEILPDDYRRVDQTVSGFQPVPGVLAGFQLRVTDNLTLGGAWRSRVKIDMDGTTGIHFTQAGPLEIDTTTHWNVPHMVRGGGALYLMNKRLMLTSELRVQFHRKANRRQVFLTDFEGFEVIEAEFNWKDVYSFMLAGEYTTAGDRPIRAGFSGSNSATPRESVQFFTPPPGPLLALYGGTGIKGDGYDIDFALSFQWGSDDVPAQAGKCEAGQQVKVGCEGKYGVKSVFVTASYTVTR